MAQAGFLKGATDALRAFMETKQSLNQAKTAEERIAKQQELDRLRVEYDRIIQERRLALGEEQVESGERIAKEQTQAQKEMELKRLDASEKQNIREIARDIQQMRSKEDLTREEIAARLKLSGMATDAQIQSALIMTYGNLTAEQMRGDVQKDVAATQTKAQKDVATTQTEAQKEIARIQTEAQNEIAVAKPGDTVIITDAEGNIVSEKTVPGAPEPGKAPTVSQSTTAIYANRMSESIPLLEQLESDDDLRGMLTARVTIPGTGRKAMEGFKSPKLKQYEAAKRDFINAVLRKESGAVISESEFENADKQYFPQPGDDPVTIEQKRRARRNVFESFKRSAGSGFTDVRTQRYVGKAREALQEYDADTVRRALMQYDGFSEEEANQIIEQAQQEGQ